MLSNAYRTRTTTAALALVAGGYLAMSGTRAEPASGESSSEAALKGDKLVQVSPSGSWAADVQHLGAYSENETADTSATPAPGESRGEAPPTQDKPVQVSARTSWVDPAADQGDPQDVGAHFEKKTQDKKIEDNTTAEHKAEDKKTEVGTTEVKKTYGQKAADNTEAPAASKRSKADSKKGKPVEDGFRSDPQYEAKYNAEGQVDIYGAKTAVDPARPLELGRQQYTSGKYDESSTILGEKNPLLPGLAIYGDWRTAVAYNNNNGKDIAQIATRLNIDVDLKITGTERIHAFFTPIQEDNAKFSRFEFGGGGGDEKFNGEFDLDPQTLFFEGDFGSLYSGFSGQEAGFDLPFTFGLFPLFLQNGIWANDAILGGAVSIPAKNSAALGLANFDVTFFAAFDNVDNKGIIGAKEDDNHQANLYGVTAFVDAFDGYIEAGYGLIQGRDEQDGLLTNFLTAAYSRRYANTISNSTRVFANFGEDPEGNSDGLAILSENSLISGLPSTLLPYANFFVGFGNPQPLVDGNGAGILKNVGINFETDALTGYPKLDDTGSNTLGGAVGLQYLFNLDQQLVFEVAMVQPFEDDGIGAKDPQYGFGVRYQVPIDRAWLFRADATYQILEGAEEDNFGLRAEVRRKF